MIKIKLKIEKGSEERITGRFCHNQDKLRKFILKKEKSVGRCEDIKNDIFDLVPQGQTELYTN